MAGPEGNGWRSWRVALGRRLIALPSVLSGSDIRHPSRFRGCDLVVKRSGMSWGHVTSSAAPEMEMLLIKQLITLPANSIAPDMNTGLRGAARFSMIVWYLEILSYP